MLCLVCQASDCFHDHHPSWPAPGSDQEVEQTASHAITLAFQSIMIKPSNRKIILFCPPNWLSNGKVTINTGQFLWQYRSLLDGQKKLISGLHFNLPGQSLNNKITIILEQVMYSNDETENNGDSIPLENWTVTYNKGINNK